MVLSRIYPKKKWLKRLAGGLLLACAMFLSVALFSYNPADPSFNRAAEGDVSNLAGSAGAYIADPLLQFLGGASLMLVIFTAIYGARLMLKSTTSLWWLRIVMLMLCLLATSGLLAIPAVPEAWSEFISMGGFIGDFIKIRARSVMPLPIVMLVATVVMIGSFFLAAGMSVKQWSYVTGLVIRRTLKTARFTMRVLHSIMQIAGLISRKVTRNQASIEDENEDENEADGFANLPANEKITVKKPEPKTLSEITLAFRKKAPAPPPPHQSSLALSIGGFELPSFASPEIFLPSAMGSL